MSHFELWTALHMAVLYRGLGLFEAVFINMPQEGVIVTGAHLYFAEAANS